MPLNIFDILLLFFSLTYAIEKLCCFNSKNFLFNFYSPFMMCTYYNNNIIINILKNTTKPNISVILSTKLIQFYYK